MNGALIWTMTCALGCFGGQDSPTTGNSAPIAPIPLADLSFFPEEQTTPALPLAPATHREVSAAKNAETALPVVAFEGLDTQTQSAKRRAMRSLNPLVRTQKPATIATAIPWNPKSNPSQWTELEIPTKQSAVQRVVRPDSRNLSAQNPLNAIALADLSFFPGENSEAPAPVEIAATIAMPGPTPVAIAPEAPSLVNRVVSSRISPKNIAMQPAARPTANVAPEVVPARLTSTNASSIEFAKATNASMGDRLIHAVAAQERGSADRATAIVKVDVNSLPADGPGRRQLSRQLLSQGRADLAKQQFEVARQSAYRAMELAVDYGRHEDSPSQLLVDIGKAAMLKAP